MRECFALKDRVVFMDICVDKSEHVYPMQIPGGSMGDLYLNKAEKS
jgi:acetolactate synthase-1/2/3 large subunit